MSCQSTYDNIGSKLVDSFYVNTFSVLPLGRPCPRVPPWESCDENTVPLDVGQGGFRLIFLGGWVEGSMESVGNVTGTLALPSSSNVWASKTRRKVPLSYEKIRHNIDIRII